MATVERHIGPAPDAVFAVLAKGWHYSALVVRTSHLRAVENEWRAAGGRLFHTSGIWPAALPDETEVVERTEVIIGPFRAHRGGQRALQTAPGCQQAPGLAPDGDGK